MFTTDLALKFDPAYREISKRFLDNPEEFELAFAKAWFKLTHRDMGPKARYVGDLEVPEEDLLLWQDPVPAADYELIDHSDIAEAQTAILDSGLSNAELVRTAWASASSFRGTRHARRGQRRRASAWRRRRTGRSTTPMNWRGSQGLEGIQRTSTAACSGGKQVSLADLIVLAVPRASSTRPRRPATRSRCRSRRVARRHAGADRRRVLRGARADAPTASATTTAPATTCRRRDMLVDKADLLDLTVPEMTVLVGGMRALGANTGGVKHGVFTDNPGTLSNDFFVNLLDMGTQWAPADGRPTALRGARPRRPAS
jgi:catalase-peroxidase